MVVQHLGRAGVFLPGVVAATSMLWRRPGLLIQQLYSVGVMTVLIVVVAG
ncbi:uncharacterized protein METZ01_LOCUS151736, partial [marine metagenome]